MKGAALWPAFEGPTPTPMPMLLLLPSCSCSVYTEEGASDAILSVVANGCCPGPNLPDAAKRGAAELVATLVVLLSITEKGCFGTADWKRDDAACELLMLFTLLLLALW